MNVQTVLGTVDSGNLGLTMMHEHLMCYWPGAEIYPKAKLDREWLIDHCTKRMNALKDWGVKTFVDPCPIELGRDVALMAEVSKRSGVNIVGSTGFYHEGPGLPYFWRGLPVHEIAEFYIDEITHGVGATGIKPGVIKVATSAQQTPLEEKFMEAACIAHRKTGIPIMTHTTGAVGGPEQQAFFAHHGVAPHRVIIGHIGDNPDTAYHRQLIDNGTYIAFDRLGWDEPSPYATADNIVRQIDDGFINRLMLSMDCIMVWQGKTHLGAPFTATMEELAELIRAGKWPIQHTYLFDTYLPILRDKGITDAQIRVMMEDNPASYFSAASFG